MRKKGGHREFKEAETEEVSGRLRRRKSSAREAMVAAEAGRNRTSEVRRSEGWWCCGFGGTVAARRGRAVVSRGGVKVRWHSGDVGAS